MFRLVSLPVTFLFFFKTSKLQAALQQLDSKSKFLEKRLRQITNQFEEHKIKVDAVLKEREEKENNNSSKSPPNALDAFDEDETTMNNNQIKQQVEQQQPSSDDNKVEVSSKRQRLLVQKRAFFLAGRSPEAPREKTYI